MDKGKLSSLNPTQCYWFWLGIFITKCIFILLQKFSRL